MAIKNKQKNLYYLFWQHLLKRNGNTLHAMHNFKYFTQIQL